MPVRAVLHREADDVPHVNGRAHVLGHFSFSTDAGVVDLPSTGQRVVAYLALEGRPVRRARVAGALWPEVPEARAGASLRSALWKLRGPAGEIVTDENQELRLARGISVDLDVLRTQAHDLDGRPQHADVAHLIPAYQAELLPGWYDDWVHVWQERWRQIRLHALQAVAASLAAAGRFLAATEAAMAAVEVEPLHDGANRALLSVHLAAGNPGEAIRHYGRYSSLLRRELAIEPSGAMTSMIRQVTGR